ncbi:MAG: DUF4147 domain-containing protein, partial [Erysipelotrichia bacterium]|nr:DUF4147 domain-containing protein [Erysipelotrichia bacterium]
MAVIRLHCIASSLAICLRNPLSRRSKKMDVLKSAADEILAEVRSQIIPGDAVKKQLGSLSFQNGRLFVIAFGKAAWTMSNAASEFLQDRITGGLCIAVKGAVHGPIQRFDCLEADHPIPTEACVLAAKKAEAMVQGLRSEDTVLCLISGGASALFEDPRIDLAQLQEVSRQLLNCGATIDEINTIRKRLSNVKGGRFAVQCEPAHVISLILSDVISQDLSMVASGPTLPDTSTAQDALRIVERYQLSLPKQIMNLLQENTPKNLPFSEAYCIGSVDILISIAEQVCLSHGFEPIVCREPLKGEAIDASEKIMDDAFRYQSIDHSIALIYG